MDLTKYPDIEERIIGNNIEEQSFYKNLSSKVEEKECNFYLAIYFFISKRNITRFSTVYLSLLLLSLK